MSRFPFGQNRDPQNLDSQRRIDPQNYVQQEPYLRRDVPSQQGMHQGISDDPYAQSYSPTQQGYSIPPQGQDPRYGHPTGVPRQDYYQQDPRQDPRMVDPYAGQRPHPLGGGGYEDPRYYADSHVQNTSPPPMFDPRMAPPHDPRGGHYPYEEQTRAQMPPRQGAPSMDPGLFWRQEEEDNYPHYSNDPERYSDRPSPLRFVFAITGLIIIATISWFAYRWASQGYSEPPVIEAESGPYKVRPENPGGINIPHQDKLIYGRLTHNSEQPAERLLPPVDQAPVLPQQQPVMQNQPIYQEAPGSVETLLPPQQAMAQHEMVATGPQPVYVQQPPQGTPVIEMPQQPNVAGPQAVYPAPYQQQPAHSVPMQQQIVQAAPPQHAALPQQQMVSHPPQKQLDDVLKEETAPAAQTVKSDGHEPKAAVMGSGIFIQLATLPNAQTAEEELKRLKAKYAKELGNVGGSVRPFDMTDGRKFRVMMGPFKTRSVALDRCKSINSAKPGSCRVTQVP